MIHTNTLEDSHPAFFAYAGIAAALVLSNAGAAYGTAKASIGIANAGFFHPDKIFRCLIPIIMAGILGIYGLIISVVLSDKTFTATGQIGFKVFAAGVMCGMSSLASGLAIGAAGEKLLNSLARTEAVFVPMLLTMIFAEAIGLFGLIMSIIVSTS